MANAIYSNARAKYQENFLLGKERLLRLIESESISEAYKVLSEVNFAGGAFGAEDDFENVIRLDEERFFAFVKETCPSNALKEYLFIANDYHNAESFMRAKHLKIDADKLCVSSGLIDREKLKEKIFADNYKELRPLLSNALSVAEEKFSASCRSGAEISLIFKKALYEDLYQISLKDPILKEIFSARADGANVSLALRTRDYKWCKDRFVKGGTLNDAELKVLCVEPKETLKDKIKNFKTKANVFLAVEEFISGSALLEFERVNQSVAVKILKAKKYQQSGIVPFMNYCFMKLAEYFNVRIILSGIINGHDKADIKRRLRESYEG